jgi:hypothetical protein
MEKFHRVPSQLKGARLLSFGNFHCINRKDYFEQKKQASVKATAL